MKRTVLLLALTLIVFFSCGKDTIDYGLDRYSVDIVTVRLSESDPYFLLDNGKTVYGGNMDVSGLKDGQRVVLNYTFSDKITPGYDYTVRVNSISQTVQGTLKSSDAFGIASADNDPVYFESVWIGSHYLNIRFQIEYNSMAHIVALLTDSVIKEDSVIRIFFRHGKKNDPPGARQKLVASYDLKPVLGDPGKNKQLRVNFNTTNYQDTTFTFNY